MFNLISKLVGDSNEKALNKIRPLVDEINDLEPEFEAKSDDALRSVTDDLRSRYNAGEDLDDLLPEAFAAVRKLHAERSVCGILTSK